MKEIYDLMYFIFYRNMFLDKLYTFRKHACEGKFIIINNHWQVRAGCWHNEHEGKYIITNCRVGSQLEHDLNEPMASHHYITDVTNAPGH